MQRNDKVDKTDLQVKRALNTIRPAYREDLWAGIESHLPPQKRNPFFVYWRSIAAVALISAGVSGYFMLNESVDNNTIASVQTENTKANIQAEKSNSTHNNTAVLGNEHIENTAVENSSVTNSPYSKTAKNALAFGVKNKEQGTRSGRDAKFLNPDYSEQPSSLSTLQLFNLTTSQQNPISQNTEKSISLIELTVNEVENSVNWEVQPRYANKPTVQNPNKKRVQNYNPQAGNLFMYAFWNNVAFTGEQGKLNLSFDDRLAYLKGEMYSEAKDNFGAEYSLPKSRFAVGVYHQRVLRKFSLHTTSGLTASARLFNIGNGYVKAGVGITYLSSKLFNYNLKFSDEIDAKYGFVHTTRERDFTSVQNTIGADAGFWYSSPRLMAGVSAKNINQPRFGRLEEGERLRAEYQMVAAYNFPVKNFIFTPFAEIKTTSLNKQAGAMMLVSYKNKITLGAGYTNVSSVTRRGDFMAQASVEIKNSLQVYAMYGQNMQMQKLGLQQNIVQSGLRYKIK